ncbi:MAG: LptF/LptG family permease [Candidatus Marinimicrobia bacterium]|nr:LptF/LptG family permease [Candidatus Neomarinimicrobiota bacterium]MCF7830087.1 LptF/LptG family permease [Candidatus Neomarinimicrobiota bacterium]MCF7882134.1 LptF/LptG family permease [Candidatus Neomarinimicrobiota bacterium]
MKLLDKYLLRKFIALFLYSMIAFLTIFLIVDVVENVDKFIDAGLNRSQILTYYVLNVPFFISTALPMSMLIASIFSIGTLSRNNELTAMKASGVSLYRITAPLLIFAFFMSCGSFVFDDQVKVHTDRKLEEYKDQYINKRPPKQNLQRNDIFIQDTPERNLVIDRFNGNSMVGNQTSIQYLESGRITKRIDAEKIFYIDSSSSWFVTDYVVRTFTKQNSERVVESSPGTLNVALQVKPQEILKEALDPAKMDYGELSEFIEQLRSLGIDPRKWEVNLYYKIAFAFTNFVVVLFGLPLVATQRKGGLAFGAGLSLFIIFTYYAIIKVGQVMGFQGLLPPMLSVWMGNIIFIIGGIILLIRTPK